MVTKRLVETALDILEYFHALVGY
jgi:hypothetical protein